MSIRNQIEKAIRLAGSESKLALATGYSQHAIWQAKSKGTVSAEMALAIHHALRGRVPASRLRPDLWASPAAVPLRAAPRKRTDSRPPMNGASE
jgi:DNA-binding transcriptional regulator YdaS (Cro superfamily)